jgi:squalene-hopene/tetraprenyl-beta-curcumene cyclase
VIGSDEAYCQPCVSPVWDTALTCHALLEAGGEAAEAAKQGLDWLKPLQVLDVKGDWAEKRPDVRPGGWAFQYNNAHYPDLDDTAVVVMAMDRAARASRRHEYDEAIARGREWVEGMQSRDGGWGAFDADNTYYYLNNIPSPITARCSIRRPRTSRPLRRHAGAARRDRANQPAVKAGVDYLRRDQLPDGSWFGRWGVNYIYGTWSVLCALNAAGVDHQRSR